MLVKDLTLMAIVAILFCVVSTMDYNDQCMADPVCKQTMVK